NPVDPGSFHQYRLPANSNVELHFHDVDEYWFFTQGYPTVTLRSPSGVTREYHLEPGDMVACVRGVEHTLWADHELVYLHYCSAMQGGDRPGPLTRGAGAGAWLDKPTWPATPSARHTTPPPTPASSEANSKHPHVGHRRHNERDQARGTGRPAAPAPLLGIGPRTGSRLAAPPVCARSPLPFRYQAPDGSCDTKRSARSVCSWRTSCLRRRGPS